jgi:hypothetical protein
LARRRGEWPFPKKGGDSKHIFAPGGTFAPDLAEWLMLAQLYQVDVYDEFPVPTIAELGDLLDEGLIKEPTNRTARRARQIQDEIIQRLKTRKSFGDLLLLGWVYQVWRTDQRRPTVAEIGGLMGLKRGAFYRQGFTAKDINKAYVIATGELKRDLPDPSGLDSVQKANLKARKPNFASLQRDLYPDD